MSKVRKMRIHRFGGKDVLQADVVEESQPDAGQVPIVVCAASVNPVDYKVRSGRYPSATCHRGSLTHRPLSDVSSNDLTQKRPSSALRTSMGGVACSGRRHASSKT